MKTLNVEAAYPMAYESFADVTADHPRLIDQVNNERRLLSALWRTDRSRRQGRPGSRPSTPEPHDRCRATAKKQ